MSADTKRTPPVEEPWPNTVRTRSELDSALQKGLDSGVSDKTLDDIIAEMRERHGLVSD